MAETTSIESTWDALARILEAFIESWESGDAPDIDAFLPESSGAFHKLALVELIKVDLEFRKAQETTLVTLDEYCRRHPALMEDGGPPADLIYEHWHLLQQSENPAAFEDYLKKYPERATEIKELANWHGETQLHQTYTTSLAKQIAPTDIQAGEKIDDFQLLVPLGEGAFAKVFLAHQVSMQRLVALKVSADRGSEPQTLAQLDHPNIVRVFDQRQLPDRNLRLLYMQYAPGGTLAGVVKRVARTPKEHRAGSMVFDAVDEALNSAGQPISHGDQRRQLSELPWAETVCKLGIDLADALAYAHSLGVLHRDVKPANVLLTADATAKLADFNISFSGQVQGSTPAAYFGGSLAYMSPEQLEACHSKKEKTAADLDRRSDIFSLAVVLWELLVGKRPYDDSQLGEGWGTLLDDLIESRQHVPQPPADMLKDEKTAAIFKVLCRCLSPDPEHRPQDGIELREQLMLCLQPRARNLLSPPKSYWRSLVRYTPLMAIAVIALVPNILSALFNIDYNYQVLEGVWKEGYPDPAARAAKQEGFWFLVIVINSIFFPLGTFYLVYRSLLLFRSIREAREVPDDDTTSVFRLLNIGHIAGGVGMAIWIFAGVCWPFLLQLFLGDLEWRIWLHFLTSPALCGMIAGAYPFFFIEWVLLRAFLRDIPLSKLHVAVRRGLFANFRKLAGIYLFMSGAVPSLSIALILILVSINPDWLAQANEGHRSLVILSAIGLLGFGAAFWFHRELVADAQAVEEVAGSRRPINPDSYSTAINK